MPTIGRPGKNKTKKNKTYVPYLLIELPGSFMRRCLRIDLRSELYAKDVCALSSDRSSMRKGALCGSTMLHHHRDCVYIEKRKLDY